MTVVTKRTMLSFVTPKLKSISKPGETRRSAVTSKQMLSDPTVATAQDVRLELERLERLQQRWTLRFVDDGLEQRFQLYHEEMCFASCRSACIWTLLGIGIMQGGAYHDLVTTARESTYVMESVRWWIVYASLGATPILWLGWVIFYYKTRDVQTNQPQAQAPPPQDEKNPPQQQSPAPAASKRAFQGHIQTVLFLFASMTIAIVSAQPAYTMHHGHTANETDPTTTIDVQLDRERHMHQLSKTILFVLMALGSISTFWSIQFLFYVVLGGLSLVLIGCWFASFAAFVQLQWHIVTLFPCTIALFGGALYRHEKHLRIKFVRLRHLMLENIKLTQQNTMMQQQLSSHVDAVGISNARDLEHHVHATEPTITNFPVGVLGESSMENVLKILLNLKTHIQENKELTKDLESVIHALLSEQDLFQTNKIKQQRAKLSPTDSKGLLTPPTGQEYSEWLALIDERIRRRRSCDVILDVPVVKTIRRTDSGYRQTVLKQVENYLAASERHLKSNGTPPALINSNSPAAYLPSVRRRTIFSNGEWSPSKLLARATQSEEMNMLSFASVCMFPLTSIFLTTIESHNLFGELPLRVESTAEYGLEIESRYQAKNPYHNAIHAASVVWDVNYFLRRIEHDLTPLHVLAALIAAAIHDVNHPGVSNAYLINTNSPLAIKYSDDSVLERMHLAEGFQACTKQGCDLFEDFSRELKRRCRQLIISMVLATDLSRHVKHVNRLKSKRYAVLSNEASSTTSTSSSSPTNSSTALIPDDLILQSILMMADLGHATKTFEYHFEWSKLITEEFFRQGDTEKQFRLPISPLCDREHSNKFEKNQIGFLEFVVLPLYSAVNEVIPFIQFDNVLGRIQSNLQTWKLRAEKDKAPSSDLVKQRTNPMNASASSLLHKTLSFRRSSLGKDSIGSTTEVFKYDSTASISIDVPDSALTDKSTKSSS